MTHDHHLKHDVLKQIAAAMETARAAAFVNILVDDLDALVKCALDYRDQADEIARLNVVITDGKERENVLTADAVVRQKLLDQATADAVAAEQRERVAQKRADDLETKYADTFALNQQQADTIDGLRVTDGEQKAKIAEQATEIDRLQTVIDNGD